MASAGCGSFTAFHVKKFPEQVPFFMDESAADTFADSVGTGFISAAFVPI
jgi:hypothetical protein